MKKFRILAAFIVICSLMLTTAQASAPVSPKIIFGNQTSETAQDADRPVMAYEGDTADDTRRNNWYSAIEGFFSMTALEETAASALPDAAKAEPEEEIRSILIETTTFVSIHDFVESQHSGAAFTYNKGKLTVSHTDLYMEFTLDTIYCYANGRILPLAAPCFEQDGTVYAPIRTLAQIYSYDVAWDEAAECVRLTENGEVFLSSEEFYNHDDYILLARLINAESGNQPLAGKVAVGNVIMNRVNHKSFPNTIKGVIYDRSCGVQFTTAYNGSLNKKVNAESYIAAKLCLEGYTVADGCYYFLNPRISPNSWVVRNRPRVMTIADHAFFS